MTADGDFVYGVQFLRFPNPDRDARRDLLRKMAVENGFNIARFYAPWPYLNPSEGEYQFDEIIESLEWSAEFGVRVLLGVQVELAPYWVERAHSDARFINALGTVMPLSTCWAQQTGGWPGLCFDSDNVSSLAVAFIEELTDAVKDYPNLHAYDVWNEPRIEPALTEDLLPGPLAREFCYCTHTVQRFRQYLQNKYESIDNLRDRWPVRFGSFEEVEPPRYFGSYVDWLDWREFQRHQQAQHLRLRAEAIQRSDPDRPLETHVAAGPPIDPGVLDGLDGWTLAPQVDVWGMSAFPRWARHPLWLGMARFEIARSQAEGKDFWLTELQGGQGVHGVSHSMPMRPNDIRTWVWLSVVAGGMGVLFWQYVPEGSGREGSGFGLLDRAYSQTDRSRSASRTWELIQGQIDVIANHRPEPEVGILVVENAAPLDHAMSGTEAHTTAAHRGYYRAIWEADRTAAYVTPRDLLSEQADYDLIVVPWCLTADEMVLDALRHALENGSTVILEAGFGLFDGGLRLRRQVPPESLDLSFYEREPIQVRPNAGNIGESAHVINDSAVERYWLEGTGGMEGSVQARTWLTVLDASGGDTMATFRGEVVGVREKKLNGFVYYFGTALGASIYEDDEDALNWLIGVIEATTQSKARGSRLRPRLLKGRDAALLIVANPEGSELTEEVMVAGPWRRARNIEDGEEWVSISGGSLEVSVGSEDVSVFRLEL